MVAASFCILLGYLCRNALSPDGVSYLDLAAAVQRADWSHFVQEYWSPLLPAVTGAAGLTLGLGTTRLPLLVHALSLMASLGAVAAAWRWSRGHGSPLFGILAIGTVLMCSDGLPRMESATPDVLLLGITVWLSCELLRGGDRWVLVGLLCGAAFLAKTSSWPWLMVAFPLRLWAARGEWARRHVAWSTAVCLGVMAAWIVPMSIKAGSLTPGSASRLNFSWYVLSNASALPDRDIGTNSTYAEVPAGRGMAITLATFDRGEPWTYQPWGDPTAWEKKVLVSSAIVPPFSQLARFEWIQVRVTGKWMLPLILAVLIPACVRWRRGMWHELMTDQRDAAAVMMVGAVGLAQFVVIHSEPRLFGPSAAMLALGFLQWSFARDSSERAVWRTVGTVTVAAGFAGALVLGVLRLAEASRAAKRDNSVVVRMEEVRQRLAAMGDARPEIAVVGDAAPLMANTWRVGGRITMQVLPRSVPVLATLPASQQIEMVRTMFSGKVNMVWSSLEGGTTKMWFPPATR